ncbi:type VII secretion integral membrane protein EccD [Smaragdicoccus niigatensis]|uniref:type VII secretion integral membrane protein EccD n=1 Tax=Smaragdicoccus niigatensis TaxID=359359 RepID=UPI00035CFFEC|nr:type VII secretion integral membrane protein EccD [Smaragdicoccus niigatensis]
MSSGQSTEPAADAVPGTLRPAVLCRLTIATNDRQVDVSVPADIPIALLLPDLAALTIGSANGASEALTLSRVGQPPLTGTLSLRAHGIADGDLLVLSRPSARVDPVFDDVASLLSGPDVTRERAWSETSAHAVAWTCGAALLVAACSTLLWGNGSADTGIRIVAAFGTAAVLLLCGLIAARTYDEPLLSAGLGAAAAPLAFTGALLLIPDPRLGGVLFGCALAGTTSIIAARLSGRGHTALSALAYLAVLAAPAALLGTITSPALPTCAAVLTVCGLAGLTAASRLSVTLSRLPIPALPGPLADSDRDVDHDLPSFAELQQSAIRADRYLAGLVLAATVAIVLGAVGATLGGVGVSWRGVALAGACAVLLGLRARTYAAAAPAAALLAGASTTVAAVAVGIAFRSDVALVGFALAAVAAGAAVLIGTAGSRQLSPPARRAIDVLELVAIAVAVPLACWVGGLFDSLSLR